MRAGARSSPSTPRSPRPSGGDRSGGGSASSRARALRARAGSALAAIPRVLRARAPNRRLTRAESTVALLVLLLLTLARAPVLVLDPRLWAEEATVHLAYAWHHRWLEVVGFVPVDHGPAGYVNLVPNLAALVATRLVELEHAPLVFTGAALAVQLLPLVVVLYGRSVLFATAGQQLLAAAVLLFTPVLTGEVWLNTINSQLFCGVFAVVLLLEQTAGASATRRWLDRAMLGLAGLTGVYAAALAPAFLLRHRQRRDRESQIQAIVLSAAAVLQLACIGLTYWLFDPQRSRMLRPDWGHTLTAILYHHFFRPVFGYPISRRIFGVLGLEQAVGASYLPTADLPSAYAVVAGILSLIAIAGFVLWCRRRRLGEPASLLLLALFCLETVLFISLVGHLPAGRYAVVPGMIVLMLLQLVALRGRETRHRSIALALLATTLVVGVQRYRNDVPPGTLGDQLSGRPAWREEVAAWRLDPSDDLQVWPSAPAGAGPVLPGVARWTLLLSGERGASEPPAESRDLERDLQLVATDSWELRSYATGDLPADFRLTVDLLSSRAAAEVDLRLRIEDEDGELLTERPITGFSAERPFRVRIDRLEDGGLLALDPSRVHAVTLAMRPRARAPTRVKLLRLRVGARVEGLLESILSSDR